MWMGVQRIEKFTLYKNFLNGTVKAVTQEFEKLSKKIEWFYQWVYTGI